MENISNALFDYLQKEQLATQEAKIVQLQQEHDEHKQGAVPTKGLALQNYKEKEAFLKYEVSGCLFAYWGSHIQRSIL